MDDTRAVLAGLIGLGFGEVDKSFPWEVAWHLDNALVSWEMRLKTTNLPYLTGQCPKPPGVIFRRQLRS